MSKIYYDVQAGAPHACETRRQTLRQLRSMCHSGQRGAEQESGVSEESRRLSGGRERANTGWTNSYCVTGHSGTQEISNQASLDLSLSGVSFMLWCWASFFSLSSFRQVTGGRVRGSFWVFLFLNNQLKVNIQKRILIFLTKEKRSFWMIAERGGWNLCICGYFFFFQFCQFCHMRMHWDCYIFSMNRLLYHCVTSLFIPGDVVCSEAWFVCERSRLSSPSSGVCMACLSLSLSFPPPFPFVLTVLQREGQWH